MSDATIWAAMGATAAATSALTGLTVHVANRVAEARKRPEADWVVHFWAWKVEEDSYSSDDFVPGLIGFRGEVMNCGDAKAFSVTTRASTGALSMYTLSGSTSPVSSGATHHAVFSLLEPGAKFYFSGSAHQDNWTDETIEIDWITSPTRLKKHLQYEFKCSERVSNPGGARDG